MYNVKLICSTCNNPQTIETLRSNRNQCKNCVLLKKAQYYQNNKEKISKYSKEKFATQSGTQHTKQMLIRKYKDTICIDCKLQYPFYMLDFDHLRDKEFSLCAASTLSEERILLEIGKCEVRCANCHRNKTYYERERKSQNEQVSRTLIRRRRLQANINILKNKECTDCHQFYNPWQMDFDHIDPNNKYMSIGELVRKSGVWELIIKEIQKCELVCINCHRQRTYNRKLNSNNI